ncbi:MAG: glutamate-1-semialdehyde 2,1-aminomutase [Flavobacteriales bacterium]|nr:glutamate-1-semialdehyde 2,1-aminomutase [Flavobacteriales bacterium]
MTTLQLPNIRSFEKSDEYRHVIHRLIPGGAHTYSKGDDQFPERSPAAITHGKGAWCWDIDGNKFLDTLMGLTAVSLGHAYEPVLRRVHEELERGVNFSRPSVIEREMAEKFLSLVPQHDMIKFAKNGSVCTTAAVKLARAYTGRTLVARPAEHPFYSYDDWFIGSTACDFGIPDAIKNLTVTYKQDSLEDLERMFSAFPGQIACIISEPEKWNELQPDFYQKAIDLAHKHGALWIMDEMITGFKTDFPGSIRKFNARPDMATWGKGIANGFSFCALTGKREIMEYGGIKRAGEPKVFLVSTTHGGETHAIAACLATIEVFEKEPVIAHNHRIGDYFIGGVKSIVAARKLEAYVQLTGFNWSVGLVIKNKNGEPDMQLRTVFMQEMIRRGILYQGILSPCYSHTIEDMDLMLAAFDESCAVLEKALEDGFERYLEGSQVIQPVFRKFN